MGFRELLLIQHARAHAAEVARPDLSTQDGVMHGVLDEQMRLRPRPGFYGTWLAPRMSA